jgi:1-acyl-sn-glycerol-3-phosphate acyltransferase
MQMLWSLRIFYMAMAALGKIIASSGQIPVARESDKASHALDSALGLLEAGHCVGIYPEGTLTRDENLWPMVAKTGIARLAIISKAPVIPVAQWGDQNLLAPYSKKVVLWKRTKITYLAGSPLDFSKWLRLSRPPRMPWRKLPNC